MILNFCNHDLIPYFFHAKKEKKSKIKIWSSFEELKEFLISDDVQIDQWFDWKESILQFISNHSEDKIALHYFFEDVAKAGIKKDINKTILFLKNIVSFDLLTSIIDANIKKNSMNEIKNVFSNLTFNRKRNDHIYFYWKNFKPLILYFIPNLINVFIGSFNFLDQKKYTSIWEKHLLLEIAYKFFVIPYFLIQLLHPILITPTKVYCVAAMIIAAAGISLSLYESYLKPVPRDLINCTNLDHLIERGVTGQKVGLDKEVKKLISILENQNHILLIGKSGEGKTTLIHRFIQMKQENQLPKSLQGIHCFEVDCSLMISSTTFGHAELISQTKEQISGFEEKIFLFFDDFYQIAKNKEAFLTFKKRFLEDKPPTKCVLAVTLKEWEEMKKMDFDFSFSRRVSKLFINPCSDEQLTKIVNSFHQINGRGITLTDDGIDEIKKLTTEKEYLPEIGRAAKGETLMKMAMSACFASFNHFYDIDLKESDKEKNDKLINEIKSLMVQKEKLNNTYATINDLFEKKKKITEEETLSLFWYAFYIKTGIEKEIVTKKALVHKEIPTEINGKLIQKIYKQHLEIESL